MARRNDADHHMTPELLLRAYACGIFPMAESAEDPALYWVEPRTRGVLPIDGFRVAARLARTVRANLFEIRVDTAFDAVVAACAAPAPDRRQTWINGRIRELYGGLFDLGHAHSVEAWQDDRLVGGLYGVRLGGAFFGESMFHRARDASKVALVHLVARLKAGGFQLLDTQFVTPHLARFGAQEWTRQHYRQCLDNAVQADADFYVWPSGRAVSGADVMAVLDKRRA